MSALESWLLRACLLLTPRAFRAAYGADMLATYEDRLADAPARGRVLVRECMDLLVTAGRLHLEGTQLMQPALLTTFVLATAATVVTLQQDSWRPAAALAVSDSIDFRATDPAGEFTLHIRGGRAVAATVDRVAVPGERVVERGDSIRVLAANGSVLVSVAYDRAAASIAWEARSP